MIEKESDSFKMFLVEKFWDSGPMWRPLSESFLIHSLPEADRDVAGDPSQLIVEGICDGRGAVSVMPNLTPTFARKNSSLKPTTFNN
jgi:hypothetical protein